MCLKCLITNYIFPRAVRESWKLNLKVHVFQMTHAHYCSGGKEHTKYLRNDIIIKKIQLGCWKFIRCSVTTFVFETPSQTQCASLINDTTHICKLQFTCHKEIGTRTIFLTANPRPRVLGKRWFKSEMSAINTSISEHELQS